jgi:murein DD-endopeptidase MepM/ murein hydrolase activator NlpD
MSRFVGKVRNGSRVRQGQTIGYVGATGLVTGAHLHYEYRINGVHRNPRTVKLPQADPIADKYRQEFLTASGPILEELDHFKRAHLATVEATVALATP